MSVKVRILLVLLGGVILILLLLASQLLAPGDTLEQFGPDQAHVVFSADHGMVLAPGACVTVRWQLDYVKAVHLNGHAEVGQGIQKVCVDEKTMPVLHVDFTNNTAADFSLNIHFLVEQPATWLLAAAALLLLLLSLFVALSRPSAAAPASAAPGVRRTPRLVLIFAGIGMAFSLLLVVGLLLELGLRFYFGQFGTRSEQNAYLLSREEIDQRQTDTIALPYLEYGLSPTYPGHNALGYRGDDIQVPKPDGVYRIVVLGDSSVYGTFSPYDQTYPYDLQKVLREEGYPNVEVVNGGVLGYTSWNITADLAFRIPVLQPDLVIVYEGGNDVIPRQVSPDCYSGLTPFLGLDPRHQVRAYPTELSPSALYRFLALKLGWEQDTSSGFTISGNCSAAVDANTPQNVATNRPVYFERNVRAMVAIAQANGFKILLSTFAYDASNPDALDYWKTAVDEHNAITTQVAQETGALLIDYRTLAPTDSAKWNDSIHLNVAGNLLQAQTFAQFLVDQKLIAPPTS
ncbi:MAG: hypothetical protein GC204_10710 [Chloroflexi bacterium]|nr:hypothetical protein [Chloroflexota bacterium]